MYFLGIVIVTIVYCYGVHSYAPQTNMDSKCDGTLYVAAANELKMSTYMLDTMPSSCKVGFYASNLYYDDIRVMISFPEFNIPCDEGKILLKGFSSGDLEFCGSRKPPKSLSSNGKTSSITFLKKSGISDFSASLRVLVTEQSWFCSSTDFECDNSYCIDKILLTCDGNDNCGDNSDERPFTCFWSAGNTAAVVLGSTAGFSLLIMIIVLSMRRARGRIVNVQRNPQVANAVTDQGIANPYYIYPQQNTVSPPPYSLQDVNKY